MEAPAISSFLAFSPPPPPTPMTSIGGDLIDSAAPDAVDPFLVEALENPRHRLTVLRMELDIQKFMQSSDQYQFEFQHVPTSYLRRAAHRVAQHYGLQTMALDNAVDGLGSRVIARKTPESRFPAVCLSEIPAKQPDKDMAERVKIAIRPRPSRGLCGDGTDQGNKKSPVRTVEERKEDYDKARARIFNGSPYTDSDGSPPSLPSDVISSCSSGDEQDGASRVAIFRDREKDRTDPDYDRHSGRFVRAPTPTQTVFLGGCNVVQPPFVQYDAGFPQMGQQDTGFAHMGQQETGFSRMGQMPRNIASVGYMPSNLTMNSFCDFSGNPTAKEAVYMQWPNPAMMMYAHSYDHFRHGVQVSQMPFYQQPLSFERRPNF